jgi:hypothetical protein
MLLLIPLSLAWKVEAVQPAPSNTMDRLAVFLKRHNYDVVVAEPLSASSVPLVRASAGPCRIQIVEASPDGWNRDLVRNFAKTNDQLFFVFRGTAYNEQPIWLTMTHHLLTRYLGKIGFSSDEMPAVAVAATAPCNAQQLPWAELRDLGAPERS